MSYAPFPLIWGGSGGGGGGASASFTTIQTTSGSFPTATGPSDTLSLVSSDGSVNIVGTALTDTVSFQARLVGEIYTQSIVVALVFG